MKFTCGKLVLRCQYWSRMDRDDVHDHRQIGNFPTVPISFRTVEWFSSRIGMAGYIFDKIKWEARGRGNIYIKPMFSNGVTRIKEFKLQTVISEWIIDPAGILPKLSSNLKSLSTTPHRIFRVFNKSLHIINTQWIIDAEKRT